MKIMLQLEKRIQELTDLACEYLASIPTEISDQELKDNPTSYNNWCLYCECEELIKVLEGEMKA